jgi:chromosomal replication initiator protein
MTLPPKVWDGVLRRLKKELAPISFEMWLPQIVARIDGDCLDLACPTQFHSERVRDYFLAAIGDCVQAEVGRRVPLRVRAVDPDELLELSVRETRTDDLDADAPLLAPSVDLETQVPRLEIGVKGFQTEVETPAQRHSLSGPNPSLQAGSHPRSSCSPLGTDQRTRETQPLGSVVETTMAAATELSASSRGAIVSTATASKVSPRHNQSAAGRSPSRAPASVRSHASRQAQDRSSKSRAEQRQSSFPLTFESFTVGSCNALAREAAVALANRRQLGLNQLFIVSGAGLGKTHLARAVVGTAARTIGERARYTTAEAFTGEFTQAVRGNQMPNFTRRYRKQCELLVVEDVQFFEGKAATQLEFFHVVQHVLDCGGRVLLTGDKFPQQMNQLDERVRARISSGFLAKVDAPDATVRRNILRNKAAHGGIRLPEDCLDLLVEKVEGNVRELEGALIQLVTVASLFERPIDVELTHESLQGRSPRTRSTALRARPCDIIESVAGFFRTTPAALASRSRRRDVLIPRQLAMYLCRSYTEASLADIGRELNRDHPSVSNAIRKIERQLLENVQLRYQAEALIARLAELGHPPLRSLE